MEILRAFEEYLQKVLGISVQVTPWVKEKQQPFFLRDLYDFYESSLLDIPCLLVVSRKEDETTPTVVSKHLKQLKDRWAGLCIYIRATISSYNRKRLINHRVSFVVPGNQMYLPELLLDLREYFQAAPKSRKRLSPATQSVIIYALIHKKDKRFKPLYLAKKLGYTAMTISRALNEIESTGIGKVSREGKERILCFAEERQFLWKRARPFMSTPIKKKVFLKFSKAAKASKQLMVLSGLAALGCCSMLAQPKQLIYATGIKDWKVLMHSSGIKEVAYPDEADLELEVWSYDPQLFAKEGKVDPFSLCLSLQENKDDRVELALEEMEEKIQW